MESPLKYTSLSACTPGFDWMQLKLERQGGSVIFTVVVYFCQTTKTKEQPPNPKPAETNVDKQKKKKTNKKQRTALQDLAEEQDKLYAELHKVARKSKWTVRSGIPILVAFRNFHAQLKPLIRTFINV